MHKYAIGPRSVTRMACPVAHHVELMNLRVAMSAEEAVKKSVEALQAPNIKSKEETSSTQTPRQIKEIAQAAPPARPDWLVDSHPYEH